MITAVREIVARLHAFFKTRDLDRDFENEIESNLAMMVEDNIRRGMLPEQARHEALVRLGCRTSLKEQHREGQGLPAIDAVLQDLRFAFRLIAKEPWFSSTAIVVLVSRNK